jgi:outer membrane protein assembly factor BamB
MRRFEFQVFSFGGQISILAVLLFSLFPAGGPLPTRASDQPQWGQAWTRNMVSSETNLPESFDTRSGKHIKWAAEIGTQAHSTPIVAAGRVYIGTNNGNPRDLKHKGDRGVLMCFDEKTGRFLWQLLVPKREEDRYMDWPDTGMSSPATVEGDRVYIVNNRGEVMCLDARGMTNGNDGPYLAEAQHMVPKVGPDQPALTESDTTPVPPGPNDADILWLFDLTSGAGIWSHDAAHSSILIHGDYLYLNTGTGVDNTHKKIRTPDAPSLVVLDKRTGRLVARDREHIAPDIFHSTWCSPALAEVNGSSQVFFGAGNGILYSFRPIEPAATSAANSIASQDSLRALEKVWQFDFDPEAPKTNVHRFNSNRQISPSDFYGMPVFQNNRIYIAGGGDLWWGKTEAWLKCIDATRQGDITTNGLIWTYPLRKHVLSTVAIYDGLIFIADCGRMFHCLDAATGKPWWTHDVEGEVWASPMVADGKVYLGTRSGSFYIFAASKEKKVLSTTQLDAPISGTVTPANGSLFLATMTHLYSIVK